MKPIRFFAASFVVVLISIITGPDVRGELPEPSTEYKNIYTEAITLFNEAKYEQAVTKLEEAIALDPQQVAAYNLAGASHVKLKNYDKASVAFNQILSIQPENSIAMFNYGESLFLAKNYPAAKKQFQGYLGTKGNKTNALARFKVILCDLLGGNESGALKAVQDLRPTISHPLEYYGRAALQFHAGNDEEARQYLQSAFQIYPGGMNLAFADSLVELGWLKQGEVAQIGAVNAAALQSLSTEFQPDSGEDSGAFSDKFESMLPSLDGESKEKDQ